MGFFTNFFDSTSYKPKIELNEEDTERQNKRLTEKERFDRYENNHIKRFVVNHFIDKNPIKDMTLKDVEILQALYRAGLDVFTEHVIIDKIHMSKKTYDDFIINNHIYDIHSVYELEYEKARFSGLKKELKDSFDSYSKGLLEILNKLASEINPIFKEFNSNWSVSFENTSDVKKFKDLISEDVDDNKITASFEDGILTINLVEKESSKPRKIEISS